MALDQLVQFAKKNYKAVSDFPDSWVEYFFECNAETTRIRTDEAGEITGFATWRNLNLEDGTVEFLAICLTGDKRANFELMRLYLREVFKGSKVRLRKYA